MGNEHRAGNEERTAHQQNISNEMKTILMLCGGDWTGW